jgi:ligand-binding sensor domain-containing protein
LWAITSNGNLYKFEDSVFVSKLNLEDYYFSCITFDLENNIWIGTHEGIIIKYRDGVKRFYFIETDAPYQVQINAIENLGDDDLWADGGAYLFNYNNDNWQTLSKDSTFKINDTDILSNCYLSTGSITEYNDTIVKLNIFKTGFIATYSYRIDTLSEDYHLIRKVIDYNGKLYILCTAGLYTYDKTTETIEIYTEINELLETNVKYDIELVNQESFWIGSSGGLIQYTDTSGIVNFDRFNSKLKSEMVWKITIDDNNNLWFINENRLIHVD